MVDECLISSNVIEKLRDMEGMRLAKKKYIAPVVTIEHYELTQTVTSCERKIGFMSSECVINDADSTDQMKDLAYSSFFNSGQCEVYPKGMDEYDSICYHTNANAAFSS